MTHIDLSQSLFTSPRTPYLFLLAIFGFGAYKTMQWFFRPYASNLANLPGPGLKHWFFGSFPPEAELEGKYEHYVLATIEGHGPVSTFTEMAREPIIILGDHRAACKVLLQTPYERVPLINDMIRRHAGAGILTAEGAQHRRQRKVAHPAFTQASVYDMAPVMHEKAADLVKHLERIIERGVDTEATSFGVRTDISKALFSAALDIIGAVGFNYNFNSLLNDGQTSELEKAFHDCLQLLTTGTAFNGVRILLGEPIERLGRLFRVKEQLHLDRSKQMVRKISAELVERAKDLDSDGTNLLSMMVRANTSDEVKPAQRLTDEEIRETVPVILFAGHETTATALSWSMLELINEHHGKSMQEKLRQELLAADEEVWKNDPRALDSLPYLDAFTRETMRIYSPVRNLPRQAPFDDVIPLARPVRLRDGTITKEIHVRKGQKVSFPISWMNRDETLWGPEGAVFKPERWLPSGHEHGGTVEDADIDPSVKELRGVWSNLASFGAGPQQCIGIRMALLEFKVIIAALVMNFDLLPPQLPGEPAVEITSQDQIVSKPVLKSDPQRGLAMPVRIRKL